MTLRTPKSSCLFRVGPAALIAVLAALVWTASASANMITVNTTKDAAPKPGDCTGHSLCSLRQAVAKAASGDTVVVPSNHKKHYVLKLGPITLAKALTIRGGGAKTTVIDGNGGNGAFLETGGTSTSPATFKIEDVTITGAKATGVSLGHTYHDAAALASLGFGAVKLVNCVISGNSATAPSSASSVVGGAVDVESGALTISHCSITHNQVITVSNNSVGAGGIVSEGGPLHITSSNISDNKATMTGTMPIIAGGAVSEGGPLTISRSTIADNKASATNPAPEPNGGGGILSDGGFASLTNVTIAGNRDRGNGSFDAGGFLNDGGNGTFVYVTLARNSGGTAANLVSTGTTIEPFGSIFALAPKGQPDCLISTTSSKGYNFSDQSSCGLTGSHDRTHGNPKLGKLAGNGGPGPTLAPLSGSPLIDFIPKAECAAGIKTDERGRPRPDDSEHACDIGAYEFQDK